MQHCPASFVYLPTLKHYAWVSHLGTRDIDLTHQGQFLTPDSQIRTSWCFISFHFRFVMYYFFAPYNNRKSIQMSIIRLNRKCSKVVRISSDIFGNFRKSSENRRKSSEVARTFSEIPVMTRQKSHAFDSEKVGRYTIVEANMLHSCGHHVARCCMMLDDVERSLISIQHRPTFLLLSGVNNDVAFVWPPSSTLLNACMAGICIHGDDLLFIFASHVDTWASKLQYGERTSDLPSNRKRKGEGVSETVIPWKARWWSDAEVDRSRAIFGANQWGAGLFS